MCGGFQPIYADKASSLSRSMQEQVVSHNEHGEKLQCPGFVPVGKSFPSIFGQ